jgi:hypothetical protein
MARADLDTKLSAEDGIFRELQRAGWQGNVQQLRQIAHKGEELRRRWEAACNWEWATTPFYSSRTDQLERACVAFARDAGLHIFLQGDCRGCPVYVATEPLTDTDYNRGFALEWEG